MYVSEPVLPRHTHAISLVNRNKFEARLVRDDNSGRFPPASMRIAMNHTITEYMFKTRSGKGKIDNQALDFARVVRLPRRLILL